MANDIKSMYNGAKWGLIIRGLLGIALGVLIIARPMDSIAALALVIAIWAVFDGIVNIVRSFSLRSIAPHWWVMLLSGIISLAFGIASFYYYPTLSLSYAVVWTAWWLLLTGVVGLYLAMQERSMGVSWGWTLFFSIVALAGGVFAVARPGITITSLISLIATFGIVGGIALLVGAGRMQSLQADFGQARSMAH
ncbi:MAG TPA: DUF308 domain-containing protein [Gemmatimonadaceae bacterium]|nr:DUF308 domain-containing protein [Gemmatimonadaceae bacterium]